MNDTVQNTITQHAIALKNSNNIDVVGNTVNGSAFHGMMLLNSSNDLIQDNYISGQKYDGITITSDSDYDQIINNTIVSGGFSSGTSAGTGIFLYDDSDSDFVFGNTISGEAEGGIAIYNASNDLIQGNTASDSPLGGIFVFNSNDPDLSLGSPPANNVIIGNYIFDIVNNAGIIIRGGPNPSGLVSPVTNTLVVDNYVAGEPGNTSTDGGIQLQTADNTEVYGNTFTGVGIPEYVYGDVQSAQFFLNRTINYSNIFSFPPATIQWDGGDDIGGNYWSGSPSTTPFTGFVFDSSGDKGGGFVDQFPFADDTLGQSPGITINQPEAGTLLSPGSTKTISWASQGTTLVDISYTSSETGTVAIATNQPNTGVFQWSVPANLPAGNDYVISITPENSAGTSLGAAASSSALTVPAGGLVLLAPGLFSQTTAGETLPVIWKSTNLPVDISLQTDGGVDSPGHRSHGGLRPGNAAECQLR